MASSCGNHRTHIFLSNQEISLSSFDLHVAIFSIFEFLSPLDFDKFPEILELYFGYT